MQLEVGKYYRTRGGHKAIASAIMPPSPDGKSTYDYPVLGYLWRNGRWWWPASWTQEGRFLLDGQEHDHDLIAPWIDPPEVKIELAEFKGDGSPRVLVTISEWVFAYDYRGMFVCLVLSRDEYTNIRPYEPASRDA